MFISDFDSNIYACVNASGPLVRNSVTGLDKEVDKLRMKYRSYIVEYDVEDVGYVLGFHFLNYNCCLMLITVGILCLASTNAIMFYLFCLTGHVLFCFA